MALVLDASRDRLRTASRAALLEEADRALAALQVCVNDLGRDVWEARIRLSNGRQPITDQTIFNMQTLAATQDALSDLLAELATPRDGV